MANITKRELTRIYNSYKRFSRDILSIKHKLGINTRMPNFPEYISENFILRIIKSSDKVVLNPKKHSPGDLTSDNYNRIECKCFTSTGPISFGPNEKWDIIYFLDARKYLNNKFVLYKVDMTNEDFEDIYVNNVDTFGDQSIMNRRPRITWNKLYPQIKNRSQKIFNGFLDDFL